jgi:hypothetical protein
MSASDFVGTLSKVSAFIATAVGIFVTSNLGEECVAMNAGGCCTSHQNNCRIAPDCSFQANQE